MKYFSSFQKTLSLSFVLARAEFKSRNEGSYLGVMWYLLNPILMFILLWFVFSQRLGQNIPLYPAYLLLGIIVFNFFQQATNDSVNIILSKGNIIKSIHFPYQSLVLSVVLRLLFSHIFEIVVLVAAVLFVGVNPWGLIFYPIILFFFILFIYGVALLLAVITVYVIDFGNIWRFFSLLLWLATPIFYSFSGYGGVSQIINLVNPLYYFISIFRDVVIYDRAPSPIMVVVTLIFSVGALSLGNFIFYKFKYKLVEKI